MATNFQNGNKIDFLPLPYIGLFNLDVLYQTSDIELLYQILYKVNEIAKSQNIVIDNFQKVIQWATEQIETNTRQQLEDWLTDGTITHIINDTLFSSIQNDIKNLNNDIISLNNKFSSVGNISPVAVDNVNKMTDTSKIYLLTASNDWYYYDGSWKIGGQYQTSVTNFNELYSNAPQKMIYNHNSHNVINGYYNIDGSLISSSTHQSLALKIYDDNAYLYFTAKRTVSAGKMVVLKYSDGTFKYYDLMQLVDYSLKDVDTVYMNFFKDTDGNQYVDHYVIEYRKNIRKDDMFSYLLTNEYNITKDDVKLENGYYTQALELIGSFTHRSAKLDIRNKKFFLSYTGVSFSVSGLYYAILVKNNIATPLPIKVENYEVSDYDYLILNYFYGGSTPTPIPYVTSFNIKINNVNDVNNTERYNHYLRKPFSFNKKKIIFCGDSITRGFINGGATTPDNYPKLFSDYVGATYNNVAVGGALFTAGFNSIKTLKQQLTDVTVKNYDYVFISGGINDCQLGVPISQFKQSVHDTILYALNNYPGSKIILITPINNFKSFPQQTVDLYEYQKAITEVAILLGSDRINILQGYLFDFPDNSSSQAFINSMYGDGLHPSELGYKTAYLYGLVTNLL